MRGAWLLLLFAAAQASGWTTSAGDVGWRSRRLQVRVSAADCGITEARLFAAVDRAAAIWSAVPMADVRIVRDAVPLRISAGSFLRDPLVGTPAILCDPDFARSHGVNPHYVPAVTRVWTLDSWLGRGAVFLNAEERGGNQARYLTEEELVVAITHEMGHLLGLGHSSAKDALMYYSIAGKTSPALSDDDRDGLTYLYPRNELTGGTFGCAAVHRRKNTPWSGATGMLLLAATLLTTLAIGRLSMRFDQT